jgi:hypothetical protein
VLRAIAREDDRLDCRSDPLQSASLAAGDMLAIPSIPTTSVAIIRTAGLIPFAGDCRAFLLALSNRQPGAELGTHRN